MLRLLRPCLAYRQAWTLWASTDAQLSSGWGIGSLRGFAQTAGVASQPCLQPGAAQAAQTAESDSSSHLSTPGYQTMRAAPI